MSDETPQRRTLMTLAYAFVIGTCFSSFVAVLLVPARLPVEYLTPVTMSGPFIGLLAGAAFLRFVQPASSSGR